MKLQTPIQLGELSLNNAILMAPMTRSRAHVNGLVTDSHVQYYTQRATAGLIISEAINISEEAIGSPFTPGLYLQEHIDAWKKVTASVHATNGKIVAQLWHTGRVGHSIDRGGKLPLAPSALAISHQQHFTSQGPKSYEVPQELSLEQIESTILDYRKAAENAKLAGFDGVELHGAFGYLPNQFLSESSNKRTDEYGGEINNRIRFVMEIMEHLADVFPNKTGIKLSPSITFNDMIDSNPVALYTELLKRLNKLPLAYIHLMNPMFPIDHLPQYPKNVIELFGKMSAHKVVANGGYDKNSGEDELTKGYATAISYGALFIANPDLPVRFEQNAPLNHADRNTFYGGSDKGFIDYPLLNS